MRLATAQRTEPARRPAPQRAAKPAPEPVRPSGAPGSAPTGVPRYLQSTTVGAPLPAAVQREMEGRFGEPLADVRVHADPQAAASAAEMGANAYTTGRHIVFGADDAGSRYAPDTPEGRSLLAHELTHVVQQRRAGAASTQRSAPGRPSTADPAEREAEANAGRALGSARLTADEQPASPVQKEEAWLDGAGEALAGAAQAVGDAAQVAGDAAQTAGTAVGEAAGDAAMALVRQAAPNLVPVIERGPMALLREMVAGAMDGIAATLNALDPGGTLNSLFAVFTGLVARAAGIAGALLSGDCQPLLQAMAELKTFVTEVAGEAWERLSDFLRPIGSFFSDLWAGYGMPVVAWLQEKAGSVWARIEQFGLDLWSWTAPVRETVGGAWSWVKEQLFGPDEADSASSSGGIVGWVTTQAGAAWTWVKQQTAPVWQPVARMAERVAEMLPPPWMRSFGQQMQQMSLQLGTATSAMQAGDGVAENRDTLASVLPSVTQVIGSVRRVVVDAGGWVGERVSAVSTTVTGVMGALRGSLFSALADSLGWLERASQQLVLWAQGGVSQLFTWLLAGFDALSPFVVNAAGVVQRLVGVVGDLMRLPQLILSTAWEAIPCCIREPIKNFVIQQILGRIPVFGQFFTDPTLWPRVQGTAMRILRQVFVDGDLAGAAWTFFQSVLRVLGLPPELVVQVLAKAAQAMGDILTNPVGFLVNLLGAMRAGFGRFFSNIGTHLLNGISGWLFAQAQEAGIAPPRDLSIGSIFGFVLDVLGVTVEHVFERLAAKLDPATVQRLRQIYRVASGVWRFVAILIDEGPAGLWREIQEQLSNLWGTVVDGVVGWVTEAIVMRAMRWLMSLLDVSGITPVINALVAVYNAIESFAQYLRQMLEIVSRVLDGVLEIAQGAIEGAAGFLEDALDRSLPVAIGFLANQFGLGRIGTRMHELMETVRGVVDRGIDWLIDRAIAVGGAILDMARSGAAAVRDAVGAVIEWWRRRFAFTTESGEAHELYVEGEGEDGDLMIASKPKRFPDFLAPLPTSADKTEALDKYRTMQKLRRRARSLGKGAAPAAGAGAGINDPMTSNDPQVVSAAIVKLIEEIAGLAKRLMPAGGGASSPPEFGSVTSAGWARSVKIDLLNDERDHWPVRGGEPTVSSARWQRLAQRRSDDSASDYLYVKGHLLNHNLGGPGNLWENLAPITQDANNRGGASMLHAFETDVKDAVEEKGGSARKFVVTMDYGRGHRGAALRQIDDKIALAKGAELKRLKVVREVVDEEQHIPSAVRCSVEIQKRGQKGWKPVKVTVPNKISTDWERYKVES